MAGLLKKVPRPVMVLECMGSELTEETERIRKWLSAENLNAAVIAKLVQTGKNEDAVITEMVTDIGWLLLERKLNGVWVEASNLPDRKTIVNIGFGLLQAAGLRITQTEFISCPTCARTSFDLQEVIKQLKEKAANLPGIKIAVMGCIVNGPGEMADADFGILGAGPGKVHIYRGNKAVLRNIDQSQAVISLLDIIKSL
jgi:(E)-4-hydroxy-3-methylbut-2-enyl-diphosphate synthase